MVGDGEMHEGQIWEALMEAGHYKLDNLVLIVDRNGFCSHQPVENVISIEPLKRENRIFWLECKKRLMGIVWSRFILVLQAYLLNMESQNVLFPIQ